MTAGANCGLNGLFNAPLNAGNPLFEYVVPEDGPDIIPFLCLPHCGVMVGTIEVVRTKPGECMSDLDGNGEVDFNDLLDLLAAWGPCGIPCPTDLTGSNDVGFQDLLVMLANWGPCQPG